VELPAILQECRTAHGFNSNGTKSGAEFLVTTATADQTNATITALPMGAYVWCMDRRLPLDVMCGSNL
jgi:hypothetical protein